MNISYIDYISDLKGTTYVTPKDLFEGIKQRLKDLPAKPDAVIFTSVSLYSEFMYLYGHDIAHVLNLKADGDIYHLTGGCFVGLQGLQIADAIAAKKKTLNNVLIVAIDFLTGIISQETISKRASAVKWGNGAALVLVSRNADGLSITDFESQTDHNWYDDFSIKFSKESCAQQLDFKLDADQYSQDFGREDLRKATELSQTLVNRQRRAVLKGLITLNRGGSFTKKLGQSLGLNQEQIFESFNERGHLGCADIFMNISDFMRKAPVMGDYVIYSCGYGYTRIAALISKRPAEL